MAGQPIWPTTNADGTFVSPLVNNQIDKRVRGVLGEGIDATGMATTAAMQAGDQKALTDAKAYTDSRVGPLATAASVTAGDQQSLSDAKAYTDQAVAEVPAPDLSGFATTTEVEAAVAVETTARTDGDAAVLSAAKSYTDQVAAGGDVDLEGYVTDAELAAEVQARQNGDATTLSDAKSYTDSQLTGYATKAAMDAETATLLSNVDSQTRTQLDAILDALEDGGGVDLTGYATETYVDEKVAGYATEQYVLDRIDEIPPPTGGGEVDLTGYATEQYVLDRIAEIPPPTGGGIDEAAMLAAYETAMGA